MPHLKTSSPPATELHYVDLGEGPPVVLIHGWPLSHRMWESQITALTEAGYRCIAYDRRGFGESGRPPGGYDYDTFAADLNDLLAHLDLSNVALAGFSMGGGEVARYVGRFGEGRISRIMLLGAVTPFLLKGQDNPDGVDAAVFGGMIDAVKKDRIAFLAEFFPNFYNLSPGEQPDLIAFSKWIAWAASPLATLQCISAFGCTDFRDDLRKVTMPTLIVHGDSDRIVPLEISGKQAHELLPESRLVVLKGAPHGFAATHARELNELMTDFLEEARD